MLYPFQLVITKNTATGTSKNNQSVLLRLTFFQKAMTAAKAKRKAAGVLIRKASKK